MKEFAIACNGGESLSSRRRSSSNSESLGSLISCSVETGATRMRPQPLICVADVVASSLWYCRLLNGASAHGGPNHERIVVSGKLVLQLHRWDVEDHHGLIGDPEAKSQGNGLLLWFEIDDIEEARARAEAMGVEVLLPFHRNPPDGDGGPNHWEIWLRDLDGYKVVLASPDGTADGDWRP